MTKFLNISVDNTLGGSSPSDVVVSSQKAVKEYVDAHSGGGGSTAVDNLSITRNSSLQIQTVGVIDSNNTTNAIKTWTGTKAQYDAIVTKDANTLYNITDDTDVSLTILEALYPVGSVYITTANTCPLSALISGSTWELVGQDRVLQGAGTRGVVGTTLNESLPNITGSLDGTYGGYIDVTNSVVSNGALKATKKVDNTAISGGSGQSRYTLSINANDSSSTYQDNAPVQPDAYLVNIFERTA